jgi:DNA invertase Pin-like site-specific DNA recombinase
MQNPNAKGHAMIIGYYRVSTDGQTLDVQLAELKAAGATRIFSEKQSGARTDRPQLRKALAAIGKGDTLIVSRLDRLARSTRDLLNTLHEVSEHGAAFKSLADAWCDTTTPHGKADDDAARRYCRVRAFADQGAH